MLLLLLLLCVSTARAVQLVPHASGALVPADTGPVRAARQRHLAALERAAQAEDITAITDQEHLHSELSVAIRCSCEGGTQT